MKLDPAIVLVVKRIAQEFKKLRQRVKSDVDALAARVGDLAATAGAPGPPGPIGPAGPTGATGPSGADGGSYLTYEVALTDAPASLPDGFSSTFILPPPPSVAGKVFTGIRIIRDSRIAVNILATAAGSFTASTISEYPVLNVFSVGCSVVGFVPFYCHRRLPFAGPYSNGVATGVYVEEFSSEVKLRADDFTPNGVESITLVDLGHYLPEYIEDNVLLSFDAGSERIWERVRFEYEYAEAIAPITVSESTVDETVTEASYPVIGVVGLSNGAFTITPSGGIGPYLLEVDGFGVVATGSSPMEFSGIHAGDYRYKVRDSFGNVFPASGWQTIHVYHEAFSKQLAYSITFSIQFTPWTQTVNVPKYDEATYLGTLDSIEVYQIATTGRASAWLENTSASAGTAVTTITPAIQVEYPAATLIAGNSVNVVFTNSLAAYDGATDWLPPSGVRNARRAAITTTTPSAALSPTSDFVGSGTTAVAVKADATGSVTGIATYILTFTSPEAACFVQFRYNVSSPRA